MNNLQLYMFRTNYINKFLWDNNIFFMVSNINNKNKVVSYDLDFKGKKCKCIIMDRRVGYNRRFNILKSVILNVINDDVSSNYLYVQDRYCLKNNLFLSKKMNIKFKRIDDKTKNKFVMYNYIRIKDLIKRQGYDNFYKQYRTSGVNELMSQVCDKYEKGLIKGTLDDYAYITSIKNMIHIYCKEVDGTIDYKKPFFSDLYLFRYLNNYFSKYVVVEYDKIEVKKVISKYYITDNESEEQVGLFVNRFLEFYKLVTNMNFSYVRSLDLKFRFFPVFNYKKAEAIKFQKFYKYFDSMLDDETNYYNFMFLNEILELTRSNSDKKNIVNYVSAFELFLVRGTHEISNQLQHKIINFWNKDNAYTKNELKIIYDYRSKVVHGDYLKSIEKLQELFLIEKYKVFVDELLVDEYFNANQLLEEKVSIELFKILKIILRTFVYNNDLLRSIKDIL